MGAPKKVNFWSTMPGVITAIAGLMTAIGGIILIAYQVGWISNSEKDSKKDYQAQESISQVQSKPLDSSVQKTSDRITEAVTPKEEVIFYDDFESNLLWADEPSRPNNPRWYSGGGYLFRNNSDQMETFYGLFKAGLLPPSVRIEITMKLMEGTLNYPYGILFGSPDYTFRNCYAFSIYGNGKYVLTEYMENKGRNLFYIDDPGIRTGRGVVNRLKIEIQDQTIKYFVNNKYLGNYKSRDNITGFIGLYVGFSGMTVFFDNLKITRLTF